MTQPHFHLVSARSRRFSAGNVAGTHGLADSSPLAALEESTEWIVTGEDCLHGTDAGLRRSFRPCLGEEKDVFMVAASYPGKCDLLIRHLLGWLHDHLRSSEECMPTEQEEQFWSGLDVQPDIAEKLVEVRAHFHNGFLRVFGDCKGQPNFEDHIMWCRGWSRFGIPSAVHRAIGEGSGSQPLVRFGEVDFSGSPRP